MTQVATQPNQVSAIPSAFKRVPINPHSEKVKEGLSQVQAPTETPQPQPPAMPLPQPSVEPLPQPPVSPIYPPQNMQPQMTYDPRAVAALQQVEGERQRLAQENAAAQQTINNLLSAQQELENLKQRQALQESLSQEAFNDLGTVDPEDAKRISAAVLNAAAPAMTAMQQELNKTKQMLAESQQQMTARMEQQRVQQLNQRLLQAHPDFVNLQNDPSYVAFMNQRDGLSSQTRDQRAAQEFTAGNVDYVIDLLNQLKGVQPSAAQIASVAPVQTANTASATPTQTKEAPLDLHTLNSMYQMRQITHDEYRAKLKEWRAAQQM